MKKLFLILSLCSLSFAFAETVTKTTYSPTIRHWYQPFYNQGDYKQKVAYNLYRQQDMKAYQKSISASSPFKGSTGAVSNDVLKGTVTQTVPKKAVTSAVAKVASKVITRAIPYVGQAAMAYDLYQALAGQNGYEQQEDGSFTKLIPDAYVICVSPTNSNPCSLERINKGLDVIYPADVEPDYACKRYITGGNPTFDKWDGEQNIRVGSDEWCRTDTQLLAKVIFTRAPLRLNFMDFFPQVAEAAADKAIEKWIKAAEAEGPLPWSEPKIYLFPGQVVQSNPYTNPETGKPEQARWKVVDDPSAPGEQSIIQEEIIERPDLTPNSPEAPAPSPDTGNDTGTGTGTSTGTETGNDDKKQPTDTEDLCEKNPDILACQKMGEPQEGFFDDVKIPHITDDQTWEEDTFLPSTGTCPQPKTFYIFGRPVELSYLPICKFLEQVRFIILAAFILMSAYLTFGSLRRE